MRLVFDASDYVAYWVGSRIPFVGDKGFGQCKAIGVIGDDGTPMAGVVWHDYQPQFGTIAFSIAADTPRWITRNIVRNLLHYPFEDVGVFKVWTATPYSNERALRLAKGLGFTKEAVLSHHFGKDHAVINRLFLRDYQRLYGVKNGKTFSSRAA